MSLSPAAGDAPASASPSLAAAPGPAGAAARMRQARLEPVGDRCVLVRLGEAVDLETNRAVHAVTALVEASALPGVVEVVPAFTSVAVHFQPLAFAQEAGPATAQLIARLQAVLQGPLPELQWSGRLVEIPACYGGEFGPDLEEVARHCGLAPQEVIALHCSQPLMLYTFYFSPGNPFAGPVDPRLQIGRRRTPRLRVEAGSVGLANGLSSIYADTSPGGWNIIARTPWRMFDLRQDPPARLQLGDRLQFKPVTPEEFHALQEARP